MNTSGKRVAIINGAGIVVVTIQSIAGIIATGVRQVEASTGYVTVVNGAGIPVITVNVGVNTLPAHA